MTAVADNPLRGPRLAIAVLTVIGLAILGRSYARGAEPPAARDSDLTLRARAAVALAEAEAAARKDAVATAARPHVAPAPRVSAKLAYPAAYKLAAEEQLPLVVFVGCDGAKPAGAVASRAESLGDVAGPAVVVAFPVGDRLHVDATIPAGEATAERVRAAVDAAAKKLEAPPRLMPARKSLPVPPDYQIRGGDVPDAKAGVATAKPGCVCGDSCKCAAGKCPGGCPVFTPPGYRPPPDGFAYVANQRGADGRVYPWGLVEKKASPSAGREVVAPAAAPFAASPAMTTTTRATGAAGVSSLSSGSYRPAATFTPAARVVTPGSTNCAPGEA
jgi:hypothetical protein